MHRRQLVAAVGSGLSLSLAGCTGFGNGPPEGWETVRDWMDDAAAHVETAQHELEAWRTDPATTDLEGLADVAGTAETLLGRYDDEIAPLEDEIEDWEFTATDGETEWQIDGDQLSATLTGLWLVLTDIEISYEWIEDADGDPDALDPDGEETIESVFELGEEVRDEAAYKLTGSGDE